MSLFVHPEGPPTADAMQLLVGDLLFAGKLDEARRIAATMVEHFLDMDRDHLDEWDRTRSFGYWLGIRSAMSHVERLVNEAAEQLATMAVQHIHQVMNQLELAFDVATSAFASDLSVTDGAARPYDVRTNGQAAGSRAQRRSGVDIPAEMIRERDEAAARSSEIDAASTAGDATSHGRRRGACSPQVYPALQQGQDLPPSTSPNRRTCGCGPIGRHRKTCTRNISTSPASDPPSTNPPSSAKREAAKRQREERARSFIRRDGVRPTREASAPIETGTGSPELVASFEF